jgi:predicted Ser/Thr protein kinase
MGEVYKATDTRLNRVVAIKVLPAVVRDDAERRQRFEREAETLASLSHPHICPIYDVGEHDGIAFLVMEYLQGQTLADRLAKERLSFDLVLRYAIQIAEALAAAHQQGVIHRDLKPGNIMLTKAGALLLDFGLAKLQGAESAGRPLLSQSARLSGPGILLGTPQYMAPEQVDGKEADARSDIYSFGAIVYEMATGTSGFADASRELAPPALDRIVKACLAKDPDERWQNAGDLARELRWIADGSVDHGVPARQSVALVSLAIAALAALGSFATWRMLQPEPLEETRLSIMTPGRTLNPFQIAISPDGRLVAFVAAGRDGEPRLFVRPIASERAEELAGTEGAFQPFWSPDSRTIGFADLRSKNMKLMRVEVRGGPPLPIVDLERSFLGGTWSPEGAIVFGDRGRLCRVSATGGPATTVGIKPTQAVWRWPHFLPDGRHFLFVAFAADGSRSLYVGSLDSDELKQIMPSASMVAYASPGVLLFVREGTLLAQPFDADRLELTGDQIPLAQDVLANDFGRAAFAVSNRGTLIYRTGQRGKWWQMLAVSQSA